MPFLNVSLNVFSNSKPDYFCVVNLMTLEILYSNIINRQLEMLKKLINRN